MHEYTAIGALSQWMWNKVMLVKFELMLIRFELMLVMFELILVKSQCPPPLRRQNCYNLCIFLFQITREFICNYDSVLARKNGLSMVLA